MCALVFVIAGQALEGQAWAVVVTVGILSVLAVLAVHGCYFALTAGLSRVIGVQQSPARTSQGGLQLGSDVQFDPSRPVPFEPEKRSSEGTPAEQ